MRAVWKYEVNAADWSTPVDMPAGARIVHVEHQSPDDRGTVTFWAEVDPEAKLDPRIFVVDGTGTQIGDHCVYVGTACVDPTLVWHLYEVTQ
jgi:hypothetical protein